MSLRLPPQTHCTPSEKCVQECICYEGYVRDPSGVGCVQPSECAEQFNEDYDLH